MKLAVFMYRGIATPKRVGLIDEETERVLRGVIPRSAIAPAEVRDVAAPRLGELLADLEHTPMTAAALADRLEEVLDDLIEPEPTSVTLEDPADLTTLVGLQATALGRAEPAAQHLIVMLPYTHVDHVTLADVVETTILDLEAEPGLTVDDVVTAYNTRRAAAVREREDGRARVAGPRGGREKLGH